MDFRLENNDKVGGLLLKGKTHGYLNLNLPPVYEDDDGIIDTNLYLGTAQNLDHGAKLEIIKGKIPIVNYDYGSTSEVVPSKCSSAIENKELVISNSYKNQDRRRRRRCYRSESTPLEFNEIQKYFTILVTEAAKELNVGLAVLKKRCREFKIKMWPYRKIKSFEALIDNAKRLGLINEVKSLEENKSMLEKVPQLEFTERTKKLRQACFRANHRTKMLLGIR